LQQENATPHILPDSLPTYELREEDVRALAMALRGRPRNASAGNQFE
jgi:hypothetical protein